MNGRDLGKARKGEVISVEGKNKMYGRVVIRPIIYGSETEGTECT